MSEGFKPIPERRSFLQSFLRTPIDTSTADQKIPVPYIDESFKREVFAHFALNSARLEFSSLILAIDGPPGEGKSFQLKHCVKKLGAPHRILSASQLSGAHEGDAIIPLYEAYEALSEESEVGASIGCLIIDDFDLSPAGTHAKTEYSVNSQLISAFLMSLADNPEQCRSKLVRRSAIFITGNNLSVLYAPLRRKGRCRLFRWLPSTKQKTDMVFGMLQSLQCKNAESIALRCVALFPDIPIATYRAAVEEFCYQVASKYSYGQRMATVSAIESDIRARISTMTFDDFFSAVEVLVSSEVENHLSKHP